MKLFLNGYIPVNAVAIPKAPKMNDHRGRAWESGKIYIDGVEYKTSLDTVWGEFFYFIYGTSWYKIRMQNHHKESTNYDIEPFAGVHLTTIQKVKYTANGNSENTTNG